MTQQSFLTTTTETLKNNMVYELGKGDVMIEQWIADLRRIADEMLTEGEGKGRDGFLLADASLCVAMGIDALEEMKEKLTHVNEVDIKNCMMLDGGYFTVHDKDGNVTFRVTPKTSYDMQKGVINE